MRKTDLRPGYSQQQSAEQGNGQPFKRICPRRSYPIRHRRRRVLTDRLLVENGPVLPAFGIGLPAWASQDIPEGNGVRGTTLGACCGPSRTRLRSHFRAYEKSLRLDCGNRESVARVSSSNCSMASELSQQAVPLRNKLAILRSDFFRICFARRIGSVRCWMPRKCKSFARVERWLG